MAGGANEASLEHLHLRVLRLLADGRRLPWRGHRHGTDLCDLAANGQLEQQELRGQRHLQRADRGQQDGRPGPVESGTYTIKVWRNNKQTEVFTYTGSYTGGNTYTPCSNYSFTFPGGSNYYYLYISGPDYIYSSPIFIKN